MKKLPIGILLLLFVSLASCKAQTGSPTSGPVFPSSTSGSSGLWTLGVPQTSTPTQGMTATPTDLPTATPTFDQLWALNDLITYSTSDFTIEILRAEAGLKEYFTIWKKYQMLYIHSDTIKTYFALWARISNNTGVEAFFDLYGCQTEMAGEPYFFSKYPPFIIGKEWSEDIPAHKSLVGGLVMLFGSRLPTGIQSFSFNCPPPMSHDARFSERFKFTLTFDDLSWAPPPEALLPFYDLPDCCVKK